MRILALTVCLLLATPTLSRTTVEIEPELRDSDRFQCGSGWVTFSGEAKDGNAGRFTFPVDSIRWMVAVTERPDRELIIVGEDTSIFLSPETAQAIRDCLHGGA